MGKGRSKAGSMSVPEARKIEDIRSETGNLSSLIGVVNSDDTKSVYEITARFTGEDVNRNNFKDLGKKASTTIESETSVGDSFSVPASKNPFVKTGENTWESGGFKFTTAELTSIIMSSGATGGKIKYKKK